jgi:beta-ureidopropionase / N-carbamoyl-L-amino-acid hydrolase
MQSINQLAAIGALPNGGVQRIAFSEEDCLAREQIQRWMRETDMQVRIDPAGNIIGRYVGRVNSAAALTSETEPETEPETAVAALATGSHIDTVPNAGHYDGAYGVLAGLEVVRTLRDRHQALSHPLEVIVFTDEERTMVGAKALSGNLNLPAEAYKSAAGEPIEHCLARVGGDWSRRDFARLTPANIMAFVELHIEQGPVLESAQKEIGVVTGIVAQRRYIFIVEGKAAHAGTTPMMLRQDALVAASQLVLAIHDLGNQPGEQVATVGRLEVFPNVANTIPARVEFSLDIRDLDDAHLDRLMVQIQEEIVHIALKTETKIELLLLLRNQPALASACIKAEIVKVCEQLSLSYLHLPSRASHDAQEMAQITDMGMIFVPSRAGISHSTSEYTAAEQCVQGANVLLHTLLRLDQQ